MAVYVLLASVVYSLILPFAYAGKISGWYKINNTSQAHGPHMSQWQRRNKILLVVSSLLWPVLLFAAGFACFILDTVTGVWCNPEHVVQGHTLWHVLAAIAYYFAWEVLHRSRHRDHPCNRSVSEQELDFVSREDGKEIPPEDN